MNKLHDEESCNILEKYYNNSNNDSTILIDGNINNNNNKVLINDMVSTSTSSITCSSSFSSSDNEQDKQHIDNDNNNERMIFNLTLLLGIGSCMTFYVFINAIEYFSVRFCTESKDDNNNNDDFEAIFGLVSNASNVMTLIAILLMEQQQHQNNNNVKGVRGVMISLITSLVVLSVHPILVLVTEVDATIFYWVCVASLFIFGVCSSYMLTQLLAQFMQLFPSHIGITPFTAGISFGGLIVSLISIGTALMDSDQKDDYIASHCTSIDHHRNLITTTKHCVPYTVDYITFGYFLTPCFILVACIYAYHTLTTTYFPLYDSDTSCDASNTPSIIDNDTLNQPLLLQDKTNTTASSQNNNDNINIYTKLIYLILSIFFIYFCTFTLFPGYIGTIKSSNQCKSLDDKISNYLFTPILFITFNIFELIGKVTAPIFYTYTSSFLVSTTTTTTSNTNYNIFLMIISFIRIIILLYLFTIKPYVDIITIILVAITGLSNGCLANTCFLHAITLVPKHLTTTTSAILNFFLYIGLFVGSTYSIFYISFLVQ